MTTSHRVILGVIAFTLLMISMISFLNFILSIFADKLAITVALISFAISFALGLLALMPVENIRLTTKVLSIAFAIYIILLVIFGPISILIFIIFVVFIISPYASGWY